MPAPKAALASDDELPPPAKTIEGREHQLVAAAFNLAEKRLHAGTASAQETVHFLKLGSVTHQLEKDKLRQENEVLKARVKEMENKKSGDDMLSKALQAFRGYAGLEIIGEHDAEPFLQ